MTGVETSPSLRVIRFGGEPNPFRGGDGSGRTAAKRPAVPARSATWTRRPRSNLRGRLVAPHARELLDLGRYVGSHDHDFELVDVTDELAALLGYRRPQMRGMSAFDFALEPPTDEQYAAVLEQYMTAGVVAGCATPLRARDGSAVPVDFVSREINGGDYYVTVVEPVVVRADLELEHWLSKAEAVAYANVSEATLERAVRNGELDVGGTRRRRLFRREWLDAWLIAGGALLALLAALALAFAVVDPDGRRSHLRGHGEPAAIHHRDRGELRGYFAHT
jgi:PAS domain S-box-containing protein/excisionase family DNA binding protein